MMYKRSEKTAKVTEYNVGEDFTAYIVDYGTSVEFWLGKGITMQKFLTGEADVNRIKFNETVERMLPLSMQSWPLLDPDAYDDDSVFEDPEGERTFPIRPVKRKEKE